MDGGFRQLSERIIHRGHIVRVVNATFEAPDGARFDRDIMRHPGAVAIVPLDGDEVVLVRQYRPALGSDLLEIPAGTMEKAGETPAQAAMRELAEEVGAQAGCLELLSSYWVAPGVSDERLHLFLATELSFGARQAEGPEESRMTTQRLDLADAEAMVADGRIVDAKSIVGLLLTAARRSRGSVRSG